MVKPAKEPNEVWEAGGEFVVSGLSALAGRCMAAVVKTVIITFEAVRACKRGQARGRNLKSKTEK